MTKEPFAIPFAIRFDMARTLTDVRTYGRTYDYQDPADNPRVSYPCGAVEEPLSSVLDERLSMLDGKFPKVSRNSEPRIAIPWHVRQMILRRDDHTCWMCGRYGDVIDHLVPRSSFSADLLWVADLSWNLAVACAACNGSKSNKAYPSIPTRLLCVPHCGDDQYGDEWPDLWDDPTRALVYCDSCRTNSYVPITWVYSNGVFA